MSFFSDLDSNLAADLVTASVVDDAGDVSFGRSPPGVRKTDAWVWVERQPVEQVGVGAQALESHPYRIHIYAGLTSRGSAADGAAQLAEVEALMETVAQRYSGSRTAFYATVPEIIACTASEETVDVDPESEQIEGIVRVTFLVAP